MRSRIVSRWAVVTCPAAAFDACAGEAPTARGDLLRATRESSEEVLSTTLATSKALAPGQTEVIAFTAPVDKASVRSTIIARVAIDPVNPPFDECRAVNNDSGDGVADMRRVILVGLLSCLAGCGPSAGEVTEDEVLVGSIDTERAPESVVVENRYVPSFEDVTGASGLPVGLHARRLAVVDYDRDGNVDLMVDGIRLFRGLGDGTFVEVTESAFPDGAPSNLGVFGAYADPIDNTGAVWADMDNDGDLDFFFFKRVDGIDHYWNVWEGTKAIDQVWINDGGVFRPELGALPDLTETLGKPATTSTGAAWADYDGDGFVDLSVATSYSNIFCCKKDAWTVVDPNAEKPGKKYLQTEIGNPDLLFHNRGDGKFDDATPLLLASWYSGPYPYALDDATMPKLASLSMAQGLNWGDFDNDGDPDLYIANYRLRKNLLYRNDGGTFQEIAEEVGAHGHLDTWQGNDYYGHSTGAAWADFDRDGLLDLAVPNLSHPDGAIPFQEFSDHTYLLRNDGSTFADVHEQLGIGWRHRTGSPAWGDINNDGRPDLFMGVVLDASTPNHRSDLYLNDQGAFKLINAPSKMGDRNDSVGILADVNNDGLLDLIAGGGEQGTPLAVLLNRGDPAADNHFLQVTLVGNGTTTNSAAIGARITIDPVGPRVWIREVTAGFGSGVQAPFRQHFGLGRSAEPVDITIAWPDGTSQVVTGLPIDRHHEITQSP